ncbi:flagellar assembly protein FliW [Sinomonas sp. ASV322]|uniref:flagellar assembly protein FliW n=1 Tax=Sinomonas sp. ASV322 TaxID=3041920 RepID=UPI0027DDB850|nr:flagellar assembly protein FliW [Sinomonas sp. ASV322]MDQ4504515.1 flagellar assembly protein FliW [Sinomonas sp. ASV322]
MSAPLTLVEPLPGLAPYTEYSLVAVEGAAGLFSLRPAERPDVRLFAVDAAVYVPDYAPEIAAPCRAVGLEDATGARILVVATPGARGTTVNLMAPLVINEASNRGIQAILDDQGWPLRATLGI